MDIQSITPIVPINKPIKIRRDDNKKEEQSPNPKSQKKTQDEDNDIQHIDEIG